MLPPVLPRDSRSLQPRVRSGTGRDVETGWTPISRDGRPPVGPAVRCFMQLGSAGPWPLRPALLPDRGVMRAPLARSAPLQKRRSRPADGLPSLWIWA